MNFNDFKYLVRSDLYRYEGNIGWRLLIRHFVFGIGWKYTFWLRLARYLESKGRRLSPVLKLVNLIRRHYTFKYGIQIEAGEIGPGLFIGHFGGIIVHSKAKIGRNCTLMQGVTIGQTNRGKRKGCPVIGDNVFLGPGAVVIGGIHIGNHVAIGPNAVVSDDIPDDSVVACTPGRIISQQGSTDYVNHTDYEHRLS